MIEVLLFLEERTQPRWGNLERRDAMPKTKNAYIQSVFCKKTQKFFLTDNTLRPAIVSKKSNKPVDHHSFVAALSNS